MIKGAPARVMAALIAAIAWSGLTLQMGLLVQIFIADGHSVLAAVWRFCAYFTLLTNLMVAVVMTHVALGGRPGPQTLTAMTVYIVIVGLLYHALLAARWNPQGLQFVGNMMVHYGTPVLTAVFWLTCVPKGVHKWADAFRWLIYPAAYLVYYVLRGATDGFYAYYFIELPKIGLQQFAVNTVGIMVVFVAMGFEFVAIDKAMARAIGRFSTAPK